MPNPKRRELPNRADGLPSLQGVPFETALRAAMATKMPKGWRPPPAPKHEKRHEGDPCRICGRGGEAKLGEEE